MSNRQYLDSVTSRIGASIMDFCRAKVGKQFYAEDLRRHVINHIGTIAPGSADRVLRDLRQRGFVDYRVLHRATSLYELRGLADVLGIV